MFIVGIAGGTGSGKTTVVRRMIELLPPGEVAILSQDSYYKDSSHIPFEKRKDINFDHPDSVEFDLLVKHLQMMKRGEPVQEPIYSFITCTRAAETRLIQPTDVVVVEGILVLAHPELRELFDLKVFVYADDDDRVLRVIQRDILERGRDVVSVIERYHQTVKPMHLQFIEPSMRYADLIIPQGGHNMRAIEVMVSTIEKSLQLAKKI